MYRYQYILLITCFTETQEEIYHYFYTYKFLFFFYQFVSQKRRRKLDPSMIGAPVNFQHLNHIGSGESGGDGVSNYFVYLLINLFNFITPQSN